MMGLTKIVRVACDTDGCSETRDIPEEGVLQPFIWIGKQGWIVETTPTGGIKTYCPRAKGKP
jgi:hypothetical protein